jgi:hypothetical protein
MNLYAVLTRRLVRLARSQRRRMSRFRRGGSGLISCLVVVALVPVAGGCFGESEVDDLVGRRTVVEAFAAEGEPVRLALDMAKADPSSPMDAYYEAARGGSRVERGFSVVVLESQDFATKHAVEILSISYGLLEVVRHKNLVLVFRSDIDAVRRQQLVALLESL